MNWWIKKKNVELRFYNCNIYLYQLKTRLIYTFRKEWTEDTRNLTSAKSFQFLTFKMNHLFFLNSKDEI